MENQAKVSTELKDVLKPVNAYPAKSLFKNEDIHLPKGYDQAIVSGTKVYGFVSNGFGLIQPSEVNEAFGNEFTKTGLNFETKGRIDSKGNYDLRFVFPLKDKKDANVGDEISAMLTFGGGLAGSRSTSIRDMVERLVCSNGMTRIESLITFTKVRNTKNNHETKFGIDFEKLMPLVMAFIENHDKLKEDQEKLASMEVKDNQILPIFYEVTKGTRFPESKFQAAYNRMAMEADQLGYTSMNRYLVQCGLNYILEHDIESMDLIQLSNIDQTISSKIENVNLGMAVKNFNAINKAEKERIEKYRTENDGKEPRGRRRVLELEMA